MSPRVSTSDALREAMAAGATTTEPAVVEAVQLEALAHRLDLAIRSAHLEQHEGVEALRMASFASDLGVAAHIVRLAARHGVPAPAEQRLAAAAATVSGARSSDPITSHAAAENPTPKATNHLGRLLTAYLTLETWARQYADPGDEAMTSEEAALRAGISLDSEYAKRCSVLLRLGYLQVARDEHGHERTRRGDSGRQRLVFKLTDAGRTMARSLKR